MIITKKITRMEHATKVDFIEGLNIKFCKFRALLRINDKNS